METLLIIGGTGSIGHSLVKRYKDEFKIIIISRDEDKQARMKNEYPFLTFILCDMRDIREFERVLLQVQPYRIIIAGALKHIDICEANINECIKTNISGVQNILDTIEVNSLRGCLKNLRIVLFISTDKACSPSSVYGMCKSIGERLMIEKSQRIKGIKFLCVRYGNVVNSRGSLIPKLHEMGKDSNIRSFSITCCDMTRFFMRLEQSIALIHRAMEEGVSGDTFIPIVESYRIWDIMMEFSHKYGKTVISSGIRPGEKIHESLINESETYRTIKIKDVYVIKPFYTIVENSVRVVEELVEYSSRTNICNDSDVIRKLIEEN